MTDELTNQPRTGVIVEFDWRNGADDESVAPLGRNGIESSNQFSEERSGVGGIGPCRIGWDVRRRQRRVGGPGFPENGLQFGGGIEGSGNVQVAAVEHRELDADRGVCGLVNGGDELTRGFVIFRAHDVLGQDDQQFR